MAVRSLLLCAVLLSAAGWVSSQDAIADFLGAVHPECQQPVKDLTSACWNEFKSAVESLGLTFPPKTKDLKNIGFDKFQAYADQNPPVSEGCCKKSCALALQGCGCNQQTFDTVVKGIGGHADFAARVFQQVADSCGRLSTPIPFQPTMINIGSSCTSGKPTFTCPP